MRTWVEWGKAIECVGAGVCGACVLVLSMALGHATEPAAFAGKSGPPVASASGVRIEWASDGSSVVVKSLPHDVWAALQATPPQTAEAWGRLFAIRIHSPRGKTEVSDPMMGQWSLQVEGLRFLPRFPLIAGSFYEATFYPEKLPGPFLPQTQPVVQGYRIPLAAPAISTEITRIFPTGDVLPENLLKFYLHFSAPMSGRNVYRHIHLRDEEGREVELPFLELNEELWDPEMRRLTLFIDPGRIKREVRPLEEIGPALQQGRRYTLQIDAAWLDAAGQSLKAPAQKVFRVGPPDRESPDPQHWRLVPPAPQSVAPLMVEFAESMDHALAQRLLRVARIPSPGGSQIVTGSVSVSLDGRQWSFVPAAPWREGAYQLLVDTALEDLAGNSPGRPFETDLTGEDKERPRQRPIVLSFQIGDGL